MANNLTTNPLIIDTAGATSTVTGIKYILAITWTGTEHSPIVANNDFSITNKMGNIIVEKRAVANGDDFVLSFPKAVPIDGLTVAELDAGYCTIWLE